MGSAFNHPQQHTRRAVGNHPALLPVTDAADRQPEPLGEPCLSEAETGTDSPHIWEIVHYNAAVPTFGEG